MIGNHLLKRVHYIEDTQGREIELRYFRYNEQREVDFVIVEDQKPVLFIDCKLSDTNVLPHIKYLKKKFSSVDSYQLTYNTKKDFLSQYEIRVCDAHKVLTEILSKL